MPKSVHCILRNEQQHSYVVCLIKSEMQHTHTRTHKCVCTQVPTHVHTYVHGCVYYISLHFISSSARYEFSLGTTAGSDDVIDATILDYDSTGECVDGLRLIHKQIYYATITAFNGALVQRNVTVHSDGCKSM